jgi:Tol biopolymer transport system component
LGFARNGSYYYGLSAGLRDLYLAELDPATGHLVSPPAPAAQRFLGTNRTPEWSPDGKYLAYLSRRGNQTNLFYKDTICIRSVESGEVRELSPKVGFMSRPRWYPDGRALLVQSYGGKNFLSLFRVDANTGEAALVLRAHSANLNKFQLSPDGKTVYGTRDNPPSEDGHPILAFDLTTGQEKEIYRGPKPRNQTLSPDGRRLAFFAWAGGKQPNILKVMPVTGGEPRELLRVESSNPVNPLAWTPDGRHLIFGRVAQSERKTELWRISVEGGEPQKLGLAMDSMIEDLHVHPDGRRMVFVAGRPKGEVWVMENFLPSAQVQRSSAARR